MCAFGENVIVYLPESVILVGKELPSLSLCCINAVLMKECFAMTSRGDGMKTAAGISNKWGVRSARKKQTTKVLEEKTMFCTLERCVFYHGTVEIRLDKGFVNSY